MKRVTRTTMLSEYLTFLENKLFNNEQDPLAAQKKMVNSIQQLVGIRNVFGDKSIRKFTVLSIFAAILFGGTFVYVGSFSQLVYLYQVLPDKVQSFQAVNCTISTQIPLSKFVFMFTSGNRLRKIMEMCREGLNAVPKDTEAHKKMASTLRNARMICWLVICNQTFTHFIYLILPFVFTVFGSERYLPTTPGDIYGIVSKYESPNYEITFFLTVIATLFSAINQTGYIVLFVTLLSHELGHFYALCETLNDIHMIVDNIKPNDKLEQNRTEKIEQNYIDDKEPNTKRIADEEVSNLNLAEKQKRINELLIFCVKHHQFIMRLHEKIAQLYKVIFGVHFLIMVGVLVTTLQTMNSWGIVNTLLTGVTGVMPLIFYCFGGEMLISAGLSMTNAAYSCSWEGMKPQQARVLLLLLCVSQYPLYYTAAGLFVMNRETFGDVVQVVYKIYAVFN